MDPEAESRETQMEPTPVPRSEEAAVDEGTLSGATSTTPLTAALLAPARATLRDWTLRRYLSAKSKEPPQSCVLYANSTVGEALTLFAEKGILSAPVLDCLKGQEATNWLGFLVRIASPGRLQALLCPLLAPNGSLLLIGRRGHCALPAL